MSTPTTPTLPGVSMRGVTRLSPPKRAREHARNLQSTQPQTSAPPSSDGSPAQGRLSVTLEVECDADGAPVRLLWRGRWHCVTVPAVRWFERRRWWAEEPRAERGRRGVVDHEIWRVQVRLEAAHRAQTRTVDLSRHLGSGRWRLLRVH